MIAIAALIAPAALAFAFIVLGLLSRRLGSATRAKPYYTGFFVAAGLMLISAAARFFYALPGNETPNDDFLRLLLTEGFPAVAATLAVILAWRYWSWLLAERA